MRAVRPSRPVCAALLVLGAACAAPAAGRAFEVATTRPDGTGEELRWDTAERVPFRLRYAGSSEINSLQLQLLVREAFATWAAVGAADLAFEEGHVFMGAAAHHPDPASVDFESAVFFVEAFWPHPAEVIALTSVSFAADGEILDADIAFNGADYVFTTGDTGAVKDFLSIVTHEVGHFVGLDHSAEPSATMFAEYVDGDTLQRDLAADDIAAATYLYPCPTALCLDGVTWVEPSAGCVAAGTGSAAGTLGLGLLGLAVLRRRRVARHGVAARRVGLALALLCAMSAAPAESSLVVALPFAELVRGADRVVRGEVLSTEGHLDGFVRTRVTLRVDEELRGAGEDVVVIEVPGGLLDRPSPLRDENGAARDKSIAGTLVFGAPRFRVGDEVVVVLDAVDAGATRVRGLAQGLYVVQSDGGLTQDLRGLSLARTARGGPLPIDAPPTLAALRRAIAR